jgi:integrase
MAKLLTLKAIIAAEPDANKRREVPDGGLPGLFLVIQPSGTKSWALRYQHGRMPRKLTLGRFPANSLADAREKARKALAVVKEGGDPAAGGRARRRSGTVEMLIEDFMIRHGSKLKTGAEIQRLFEYDVLSAWGDREVVEVGPQDVIELLNGIVDRGAPYTANQILAAVRKLFNWAVDQDRLAGSPCVGIKRPTPIRSRDRILTDGELRFFWQATGEIDAPFGPFCRLLLLTGQRRSDVERMRWSHMSGPVWEVSDSRAKNSEPHIVHLTDAAMRELARVPRAKGVSHVFPTNHEKPIGNWSWAKSRLDARMVELADAGIPPWQMRDLRRTVSAGMARAGVDLVVVERCLTQTNRSFGGSAGECNNSSHGDGTREAWQAWTALLLEIVGIPRT